MMFVPFIWIFSRIFVVCWSQGQDSAFTGMFFEESGASVNQTVDWPIDSFWVRLAATGGAKETFWLRLTTTGAHHFHMLVRNSETGIKYNQRVSTESKRCLFSAASSLIPQFFSSPNISTTDKIKEQIRLASVRSDKSKPNEFLAVSLCSGISGIVQLYNSTSYVNIHSKEGFNDIHLQMLKEPLHKDFIASQDNLERNLLRSLWKKRVKRASFQMPLREMPGPFLVELYMIVDSKMARGNQGDGYRKLLHRITAVINNINMAFSQFNIYFTVVQLEIWEHDQIKLTDENHILMELQLYKRRFIRTKHDCLHAIIGENLGSSKRGQAEPASMCGYNSCVGYTKDYYDQTVSELSHSVLHELGHNFGLHHDTEQCQCFGCIMATGVEFSSVQFQWSNCSKREIVSLLNSGVGDCLLDRPNVDLGQVNPIVMEANHRSRNMDTKSTAMCGNGVVDLGEQCDCGSRESCPSYFSNCCNPSTCQFRRGASCAGGPCCNLNTCSMKLSGTICRESGSNSCDLPEYCDGRSEWCPSDVYKEDGSICTTGLSNEMSYCYRGSCRTRKSQCQTLWGDTGYEASSTCYALNEEATLVKNCGLEIPRPEDRDRQPRNWNNKKCTPENSICGRLWCSHDNERVLKPSVQFVTDEIVHDQHCSAVRFDMDWFLDEDGMVPNGASCGSGKVCWKSECVPVSLVRLNRCLCNNHGVCNNRGNCHCDYGFAPPNCTESGHGGSVDSGPPVKFNRHTRIVISSILISIVVLLSAMIIALFIYHYRNRRWPDIIHSIQCPNYKKEQLRSEQEKPTKFENQYYKIKRPSVLDIDMIYMSNKSPIYSPKSPGNINRSLLSPKSVREKAKFLEGIQKKSDEKPIVRPELKPKPSKPLQDLVPGPDKEDKQIPPKSLISDSVKFETTSKKPSKITGVNPGTVGLLAAKKPPILTKKPDKAVVQTDSKNSSKEDNTSKNVPVEQVKTLAVIGDKRPPILASKPPKSSLNLSDLPQSEEPQKSVAQLKISGKLNEKLNTQLNMNAMGAPPKKAISKGIDKDKRPPITVAKPQKQQTGQSLDQSRPRNISPLPATQPSDSAPSFTGKISTKPSSTIGEQSVNSTPNKPEESKESSRFTRPLKYNISHPKLEETSNRQAIEDEQFLLKLKQPPPLLSEKPLKESVEPNKSAATQKMPNKLSKPSKYQISQPRLDQTTCTDATRDLPATDKTLTRDVAPHKILKCDTSTAVKFL